MATYNIAATYYAGASANIELPEGKTWADVKHWYIKWDTLFIQWENSREYQGFDLNSDTEDVVDWKRPTSASIYEVNGETGETDYDKEVASC